MLQNGIFRRSDNPWATPLQIVTKKEDGWRPCGDYRALKARTVLNQYPFRHIADIAQDFQAGFQTLDLVKVYHKIPVHPDEIAKPAIITPLGL
jgi:hypothetical protein